MKHATQPVRINRHLLRVICELVTGITLTLGLWPFHAPRNDVSWLPNQSGLHFGRFSTAFSSVEFRFKGPTVPASASLEIWLQPRRIWDFSTFLAFYTARRPSSFSLRQAQTSLLLQTAPPDGQARTERKDLYVEDVFRKNGPSYITITSGKSGTAVYLDGVMAKIAPQVGFSTEAFAGQLILGDSAGQGDSWSGELLGLSIYNQTLTGPEVLAHYRTWTQAGRPQLGGDPGNAALYLLDEHSGRTIHSNTGSGPDLQIPERYTVVGQVFLENPWVEFKRSQGYWRAIVKNIIGFIPFGCCFYAYFLQVRQTKRATFATLLSGFGVSLTIEVLQAFLPTRASGVTDLVTNTIGTWVGILAFSAAHPMLTAWLPWWPFVERPDD
jgi:hypothetical protein